MQKKEKGRGNCYVVSVPKKSAKSVLLPLESVVIICARNKKHEFKKLAFMFFPMSCTLDFSILISTLETKCISTSATVFPFSHHFGCESKAGVDGGA